MIDELRRLSAERDAAEAALAGHTASGKKAGRSPLLDALCASNKALDDAARYALPSLLARLEAAEAVVEVAVEARAHHRDDGDLDCGACRHVEERIDTALAHYDAVRKETR